VTFVPPNKQIRLCLVTAWVGPVACGHNHSVSNSTNGSVVVLMVELVQQVIHFIRASRESHSGELVLVVRPNGELGTTCVRSFVVVVWCGTSFACRVRVMDLVCLLTFNKKFRFLSNFCHQNKFFFCIYYRCTVVLASNRTVVSL